MELLPQARAWIILPQSSTRERRFRLWFDGVENSEKTKAGRKAGGEGRALSTAVRAGPAAEFVPLLAVTNDGDFFFFLTRNRIDRDKRFH
jgi:hypothetical protein